MANKAGASPLTGPGNMPADPVAIARAGRVQLGDPSIMGGPIAQPAFTPPVAGVPGGNNAQGVTGSPNLMDGLGQPRMMMGGDVVDMTGKL